MTEQTQTTGRSTTAIVLALIFFFPLGFYWVYNQPGWSVGKKWLFVIPVLLILPGAFQDAQKEEEVRKATEVAESTEAAQDVGNEGPSSPELTSLSNSSYKPSSAGTHYSSRPANSDGDKYDKMGDRMIRNLRSAGTLTPGSEEQARKLMDAYRKLD